MPWESEGCMAAINSRSYFLVVGGSGGIGSAICKLLVNVGLTPIVGFNTNSVQAESLAQETGGYSVKINMSNNESIREAVQRIEQKLEEGDELVGVVLGASPPPDLLSFSSLTSEQLLNQLQINVVGPHFLISCLIKKFFRKVKRGSIIGILSQAISNENKLPATGMAGYVVAKESLKSMLRVCSAEYPWLKIRTHSPDFTKTEMLNVFDARYLEMMQLKKKLANPEEVAYEIISEIIS